MEVVERYAGWTQVVSVGGDRRGRPTDKGRGDKINIRGCGGIFLDSLAVECIRDWECRRIDGCATSRGSGDFEIRLVTMCRLRLLATAAVIVHLLRQAMSGGGQGREHQDHRTQKHQTHLPFPHHRPPQQIQSYMQGLLETSTL